MSMTRLLTAVLLATGLSSSTPAWADEATDPRDPATLSELEVAVDDLDGTLTRARYAQALAPYHPAVSSALAVAEEARIEVARLAVQGDLGAALWQAGEAREQTLLVLEHVRMAELDAALAVFPVPAPGSGGDVR